jgi:hypothetical protein
MDVLGPKLGVFRASTGILWRLAGVLMLVLLPMVVSRIVMRFDSLSWRRVAAVLGSLLLVPVLVFGLVAPLVWVYRIRVHELGLRAYDAYGRFFSVRWGSMTDVRRVDLLTLPYLRVRTAQAGVELVIPLFLAEQAHFERLVSQCAGPLNPLSRHFENAAA